jgi:hypothetical protein
MSVEYTNFKIVKIIKCLIDSCVFYTLSIVTLPKTNGNDSMYTDTKKPQNQM